MDKYPPELLHKIFVLVAPGDIKTIRQISRYWNEVVENISGLEVRLNDTKKGNRRFVESVKLKHLIVEHLSTHHFCPKYPHSLLKLTCLRPARLWFLEEALKLQNLTSLQLVDKFFYLQDLPQLFQPGALKNAYLPSLKFLTIEMPVTFQSVNPPMACGVYPKMEEKIAERAAKNIWFILQVIRSPKLENVHIIDDFPRCITNTIQKYQWWGQVFAGFIHYHQYSLKSLRFKKVFIPYPEDPFTTENIGIPLSLQHLSLSILGADLGNFHYWRAVVQAQEQLQSLELHLSGSFWMRYSITPFIKLSKNTLREIDLTLEYDSDLLSLYPDSDIRFDFAPIAACDELTSLKLGPCGYLAPTTNFSLIPRLLTKLSTLHLTFVDISTEELQSITEFENLRTLCLQCLIHVNDGCIYSSVDLPLLKSFLAMRTLDSFAADLIAIDGSKNPLIEMSTRLFGLRFKGSGFYFPFELEDQMTTSSSNLRTPPPNHGLREGPTDEFPLFHQNVSDEGGNILPYSEDGGESPFQVPNFDHQDEIMRQLEDLDEKDEPSSFALSDVNDSISSRCPCETKARVSRRPDRCVSRFCILAMVDICEDLMRADKLPLWDLYMDGLIPYYCTREFLPDPAPDPANEDECCCVEWSDSDTDQYSLPDDSNIQTHVCMQLDFETRTDSDDVVTCAEDVEGKDLETSDTNEISSHYIDELQAGHDPNQCTNSVNELDSCSDVNFEDNPEGLVHLGDPVLDCIIKETQEGMNALRTHDTAFNLTIHSDRIVASKEVSMSADVLTPGISRSTKVNSSIQHAVNVADCETQSRSILFRDEEEGRVGRAVDIQKEMTVANMETQKEVEIVDTAIQYKITPVSDEDIKTQIDMESEDCSHVFIQTTMETNELLYPETVKYNSVKSIKHTCSLNTQPNLSPCNENDQNERVQKDKVSLHQDYEELPITAKDKKSSEVQYDSKKSQSQKVVDEKRSSNHSIFPEHTDKKTTDTRRHSLGNGNLAKFWSKPSKTCVIRNRRCAIL